MPATIKIKNSSTTGAVPTSGDLVQGELAVNVTDTGLYTENASGTVVKLNAPSIDDKNTGATKHLTISTAGNLGLGVTPSSWGSTYRALDIQYGGIAATTAGQANTEVTHNAYYNGTNWIAKYTGGYGTRYAAGDGGHAWHTSSTTTTGGSAITFTQAMTLDASGNLGIGTTSPTGAIGAGYTSRFTAYVAGGNAAINIKDPNGDWFLGTTGGAFTYYSNTAGAERARIDSSGNFQVGAAAGTPTTAYIATGSFYGTVAAAATTTMQCWNQATSGNNTFISFYTESGGGALRGSVVYNRGSGVVAYNTTSDYRAKTVNGPVENALAKVALLKPCNGRMNDGEIDLDFFVAHELQEVVPSAVTGEKDAVKEDGTPDYQMVDKTSLIPLLTAAIQEQQAIITQLQADIETLKGQA